MSGSGNPWDTGGELVPTWDGGDTGDPLDSGDTADTGALAHPDGAYDDVVFSPAVTGTPNSEGEAGLVPIDEIAELVLGGVLDDIEEHVGFRPTTDDALYLLDCAGLRTLGELWGLEETIRNALAGKWDEIDTCTLFYATRVAVCAARRLDGLEYLPDLMSAWLEGNADSSGYWRVESIGMSPGGPTAAGTSLSYFELPREPYLVDLRDRLMKELRAVYHLILGGACDRLQALPGEMFPKNEELGPVYTFGADTLALINGRLPFPAEPNALLSVGTEWMASQIELKVAPGEHKEISALGSVVLLSYVEVTAVRGQHTVTEEDGSQETKDGWIVSIPTWKLRLWDEADFELDNPFEYPIPGSDRKIEIPDNVFRRIQDHDCWLPRPKDFLVMTSTWELMSVSEFGYDKVFLPDGADCGALKIDTSPPVYEPL